MKLTRENVFCFSMCILARILVSIGKFDEAVTHLRIASRTFDETIGLDHEISLSTTYDLASALQGQGDLDEATTVLERWRKTSTRVQADKDAQERVRNPPAPKRSSRTNARITRKKIPLKGGRRVRARRVRRPKTN